MDVKVLRNIVRRSPFRSFTLRMNDGREFGIRHPEWISVTPSAVSVGSPDDRSTTVLEPNLIASLYFAPTTKAPPQGGPGPGN